MSKHGDAVRSAKVLNKEKNEDTVVFNNKNACRKNSSQNPVMKTQEGINLFILGLSICKKPDWKRYEF